MIDVSLVTILLNYNSPKDTLACLKSLAGSTVVPFVVLVDNGSAPAGRIDPNEVECFYPHLHLISSEKNLGFGAGNNLGMDWALKNTLCRYLYILNNDTISTPNSIRLLIDCLDADAEAGGASPRIMVADEPDVVWFAGGHIDWARGGGRTWFLNRRFDGDMRIKESPLLTGCAMFLRRDVLEALGGFDERFFMYCEDTDLSARISRCGIKSICVPESVVYHKAHSSIRGSESGYFQPEGVGNPALCFYVENVVYGSMLNMRLHARPRERVFGLLWLGLRFGKWALEYLRFGRLDAIRAMGRGYGRYRKTIAEPGQSTRIASRR